MNINELADQFVTVNVDCWPDGHNPLLRVQLEKMLASFERKVRLDEHKQYCWTCLHQSEDYKKRGVGSCLRAAALEEAGGGVRKE